MLNPFLFRSTQYQTHWQKKSWIYLLNWWEVWRFENQATLTLVSVSTSLLLMRKKSKLFQWFSNCFRSRHILPMDLLNCILFFTKTTLLLKITTMVIFCPREALMSRPAELSYGIINIHATKVRWNLYKMTVFFSV